MRHAIQRRARRVRRAARDASSLPHSRVCRTSVLPADHFDVPLTYEDMEAIGTGLGAAGFVVYDDSADMVSVARAEPVPGRRVMRSVPACKTGSMEITDRLLAIEQGAGSDDDLAEINARLRTVTDANRCYLGTEEQNVVSSILRAFPDAFAARLEGSAGALRPALVPLTSGECLCASLQKPTSSPAPSSPGSGSRRSPRSRNPASSHWASCRSHSRRPASDRPGRCSGDSRPVRSHLGAQT